MCWCGELDKYFERNLLIVEQRMDLMGMGYNGYGNISWEVIVGVQVRGGQNLDQGGESGDGNERIIQEVKELVWVWIGMGMRER